MKVATLNDGTPDGQLVIVSDDLTQQHRATDKTLQQALDRDRLRPNPAESDFNEKLCCSPLPRAYQFLDGSAYVNHVELLRKSRGVEMPASFWAAMT